MLPLDIRVVPHTFSVVISRTNVLMVRILYTCGTLLTMIRTMRHRLCITSPCFVMVRIMCHRLHIILACMPIGHGLLLTAIHAAHSEVISQCSNMNTRPATQFEQSWHIR
jgi:hypothetical protein